MQWQKLIFVPTLAALVLTIGGQAARAQAPVVPAVLPAVPGPVKPRMFIDPSSTHVSCAKASLTVSPLRHRRGFYMGDYQLKVFPYFFKSETGFLSFFAPEDFLHKLAIGAPVEFTGKATNSVDGKVKDIKGKAVPSASGKGVVTVTIVTDNGDMIFNTTYHFAQ